MVMEDGWYVLKSVDFDVKVKEEEKQHENTF